MFKKYFNNDEIEQPLIAAKYLLIFGTLVILLSPFILTRPAPFSSLDLTNAKDLGDTIGGLTSPVVGMVGAVLIFLALRAQVTANRIIQVQLDEQQKNDHELQESQQLRLYYQTFKDSIDNFSYRHDLIDDADATAVARKGSEAIFHLLEDFYCEYHPEMKEVLSQPKLAELISIIDMCNSLLNKVEKSTNKDKEVFLHLTLHQFIYRVYPKLRSVDNVNIRHCEVCNRTHGLPENVISTLKNICRIAGLQKERSDLFPEKEIDQ